MKSFIEKDGVFLADGEPYTIISGAMHYFRIPREYWHDRLLKLRECGFNTVETYCAWNMHEKLEGRFDFSGMLDIGAYIAEAEALGLNVILRPGPYICAEWEMGGLPAWLLGYKDIELRCSNPIFLEKVGAYFDRLLPVIRPHLLSNGGGVIMLQIENEYGSYGDDSGYLYSITDIYRRNGIDCLLYTSDGATDCMLSGGSLPEYPCVVNFGSRPEENFAKLKEFRPDAPVMCGEYWVGWFDHWYDIHHTRDPEEVARLMTEMLESGASLNFYMFHGGTNFGFMNGANYYDVYTPTVTSYDYSALLSEAGDMTPAYYAVRRAIEKYTGKTLPPVTSKDSEKAAYGVLAPTGAVDVFTAAPKLTAPAHTQASQFTDDIKQYYGFTLYHSTVKGPREGEGWELNIDHVHDRATVFIDREYRGFFERSRRKDKICLPLEKGQEAELDILCENMGRVNYGPRILDRKGLRGVRFGLQYHFGWDMYPLDMEDLSALEFGGTDGSSNVAAFFRFCLHIDGDPRDTFVKPAGLHRGVIVVNGFNIGRYYPEAGPQVTLYLPAPFLKQGDNEIIVFESDHAENAVLEFVAEPELGPTENSQGNLINDEIDEI